MSKYKYWTDANYSKGENKNILNELVIGQAVSAASYLCSSIADIGIDVAKKHIQKKIDEKRLKESLQSFIEHHKQYNYACSLAEEIDFEGFSDFIRKNLMDKVSERTFAPKKSARKGARQTIVDEAVYYSKAKTDGSRKRVATLISIALDIIHEYYRRKIDYSDWIIAGEIVDAVAENIKESENNIEKTINQKTNTICAAISDLSNKFLESPFSLDSYYELAKAGQIGAIGDKLKCVADTVSTYHPLYPHYKYEIIGNTLKSVPASKADEQLFPQKFVCRGTARMGNIALNHIDDDVLNYADRHQLEIKLTVNEAQKLLGDILDPQQDECTDLVGQTLIRLPKAFPPAFPCSVKVDGNDFINYVELRTVEILDDGTYIVNNTAQINSFFIMELRFNFKDPSRKIVYNMKTAKELSNGDLLKFLKLMKAAGEGQILEVYALNLSKNIIEGKVDPFEYETGFENIDKEIDFLERVCDIESYFNIVINIPTEIYEKDFYSIQYVSDLIRGQENIFNWNETQFKGIVDDSFRNQIEDMTEESQNLALVGTSSAMIFGTEVDFSIMRVYPSAKIKDLERLKNKLKYTDNGEEIRITYVPGDSDNYIDTLKPENFPEEDE